MIWLPEIIEPAENFAKFFNRSDNKITQVRNVWCLDYRNQGLSDHHDSYDMEEMTEDIIRFMDTNKITTATIGGHGFGAKVAAATANANLERFTGVIQLEGGPLDHKYHEAYQELDSYVKHVKTIKIAEMDQAQVYKAIDQGVACKKWASIFKQNVNTEGSALSWTVNMEALHKNMSKHVPDVAHWSESYGLWPGQTLAIFAANSRWIHLSTNTLPFYNVFPMLDGQFPQKINTHADDLHGPMTHWIHEEPSD
jgi:pimeloyl-ACP methyl ester carboxylesterase